ncbi:hypothetical protein KI387_039541 [Taxus chinensis]|uniref:DUF4283 domain-containing protein n=1 Tax=Taxus chinensis TaxID=29808 RepID=A0AA38CFV5_TAXCH|nr:hypothetical protein KI387_039541 [Taxus chinensis]
MVKRRHGGHGGLKNSGDDGRRAQELLRTEADHVLSWIDQAFCDAKAAPNPAGSSHGDGSHLTPLPKTRSSCADHSAAIGVCNSGRAVGGGSPLQPLNRSSSVDLHTKLTKTDCPDTRVHVLNNNPHKSTTFKDILQGRSIAQGMSPITPLTPAVTNPSVAFGNEVLDSERFYLEHALIGRFSGLWPNLATLHDWITKHWIPILSGKLDLYPCAKGTFIVVFSSIRDKEVIDKKLWALQSHYLVLKPWFPAFNPITESFACKPVWIRMPHLPLQFWDRTCLTAIGNTLGHTLFIDPQTTGFTHTTFARILVELDTSKNLPANIELIVQNRTWTQSLDYEGLPFRCRKCFATGHTADVCGVEKRKNGKNNWWKNALPEHLIFEAKEESSTDIEDDFVLETPLSEIPVVECAKESHSVGGIKKDTKEDNESAVPVGSMEDKENTPPCFNTLITEAATGWITVRKNKKLFSKNTASPPR